MSKPSPFLLPIESIQAAILEAFEATGFEADEPGGRRFPDETFGDSTEGDARLSAVLAGATTEAEAVKLATAELERFYRELMTRAGFLNPATPEPGPRGGRLGL